MTNIDFPKGNEMEIGKCGVVYSKPMNTLTMSIFYDHLATTLFYLVNMSNSSSSGVRTDSCFFAGVGSLLSHLEVFKGPQGT